VLSTGLVMQDASGQWLVLLPAAPWTSGAPVLDEISNLVGITSTGYIGNGGAEAGIAVTVVPGKWILELVKGAEDATADLPCTPVSGTLKDGTRWWYTTSSIQELGIKNPCPSMTVH
jgi:hypothetical protein